MNDEFKQQYVNYWDPDITPKGEDLDKYKWTITREFPKNSKPLDHIHEYGASGYCLKCGQSDNLKSETNDNQKDAFDPIEHDPVQKPSHYRFGPLETIEVIKGSMPQDQYIGYLKGNIIKYICRAQYKNGKEDIAKAVKYISWLADEIK